MTDERSPQHHGGDQGPHTCVLDGSGQPCGDPRFHIPDVRHSDRRWNWMAASRTVEFCGKPLLRAFDHQSRRNFTFGAACDSWEHRLCADARAGGLLEYFWEEWSEYEQIFYGRFDESALPRVRQRRAGSGDEWLLVKRHGGDMRYFSTGDHSGGLEPVLMVPLEPPLATLALRDVLHLPGVKRVWRSPGWRSETAEADTGNVVTSFGAMGDRAYEAAVRTSADEMSTKYRVDVSSEPEVPLPSEVPKNEWVNTMRVATEAARQVSRQLHRPEA